MRQTSQWDMQKVNKVMPLFFMSTHIAPPVIIMANIFSCFLYVSSGYTLFQNTDLIIISPNILLLNILLDKIGVNIQGCIFLLWLKLSLINSQNCDAKYCYFYECLVFLT